MSTTEMVTPRSWNARAAHDRAPGRKGAAATGSLRHKISRGLGYIVVEIQVSLKASASTLWRCADLGGPWWAQHSARMDRSASAPSTSTRSPDGTVCGGIQLPVQLLAEQVQHDPLSVALLTRAARRQLAASLDGSGFRKYGGLRNTSTGGSRDAIWLPVVVPEPFVYDLPVWAGPPSHYPGALQLAADLVDALPGRNASSFRELVVVKRTRTKTHRFDDAVATAARLHDRQYAPRTWSRLRDTPSSSGIGEPDASCSEGHSQRVMCEARPTV